MGSYRKILQNVFFLKFLFFFKKLYLESYPGETKETVVAFRMTAGIGGSTVDSCMQYHNFEATDSRCRHPDLILYLSFINKVHLQLYQPSLYILQSSALYFIVYFWLEYAIFCFKISLLYYSSLFIKFRCHPSYCPRQHTAIAICESS